MITAGLVALTIGVVAQADQKADEKFCASAAAFDSNVAELNAIGPHSMVAELRGPARDEKARNHREPECEPAHHHGREQRALDRHAEGAQPDDAALLILRTTVTGLRFTPDTR
jgi:hypothetical protein